MNDADVMDKLGRGVRVNITRGGRREVTSAILVQWHVMLKVDDAGHGLLTVMFHA